MLILTRKVTEALVINDDVQITILGMKGNQVRIGIAAPKEVQVHRQEIYQKIQKGIPKPKSAFGQKLRRAFVDDDWIGNKKRKYSPIDWDEEQE